MTARPLSAFHIWRWPVTLAALSILGLLSALLGEGGVWWALSWISLAAPLAVIAGCLIGAGTKARLRSARPSHDV